MEYIWNKQYITFRVIRPTLNNPARKHKSKWLRRSLIYQTLEMVSLDYIRNPMHSGVELWSDLPFWLLHHRICLFMLWRPLSELSDCCSGHIFLVIRSLAIVLLWVTQYKIINQGRDTEMMQSMLFFMLICSHETWKIICIFTLKTWNCLLLIRLSEGYTVTNT